MEYISLAKQYYKDQVVYENLYRYRTSSTDSLYTLPVSIGKNAAFFVLSKEVNKLNQDIYIRNNKLSRLYNGLPTVARNACLRKSIIDEILLSNDIEGVYSTRKELHIVMKKKKKSKVLKFEGLVNKYQMILNDQANIPLANSTDVRNLYDEIILKEIDTNDYPDGKVFRKESVSVYTPADKEIHQGINPEKHLIDFMDKTLEWLEDSSIPHILRISVYHYLFGYMHPFYDGNGRLSRFISSYLLKETLNFLVSFRISYIISNNKKKYYESFEICNDEKNRGDITPFVIAFLEIVYQAVESLIDELDESKKKLAHYNKIISAIFDTIIASNGNISKKTLDNQINILYIVIQNSLFSDEPISIQELCSAVDLGNTWTRNCLSSLIELGYINKVKQGHSVMYEANFMALDQFHITRDAGSNS